MQRTKIEYLTHSWSPIKMFCTPVSSGCTNCWAIRRAKMLARNPLISKKRRVAYLEGAAPILDHKELEAPLHLKKPARIGVQFMGDLFHNDVSIIWIEKIFRVMVEAKWHQFFVLTKRPEEAEKISGWIKNIPNLWSGVSIEDQPTADERIPILLQIPAAHRWLSVEPMLESIDIRPYVGGTYPKWEIVDWVVCGGETGPKARPLHSDWVRSLKDQCQAAGVPFFFKSWGEWLHQSQFPIGAAFKKMPSGNYIACELTTSDKSIIPKSALIHEWPDGTVSIQVGTQIRRSIT